MSELRAGTLEQTFRASVGGTGADIVTDGTAKEVVLPPGVVCRRAYIQVQNITKTTFDPYDDAVPFEWSRDGVEDGYLFSSVGKAVALKREPGESLGFVKAATGKKIIVYVEF